MFLINYLSAPDTARSVKALVPVASEQEYRELRSSERNLSALDKVRKLYNQYGLQAEEGADAQTLKNLKTSIDKEKGHLVQFCYSCAPGADMLLKGCTQCSAAVGMDVDFDPASPDFNERMKQAPDQILSMADQLGLLMLERSAGKGYHMVFRRHADMSQEDNLRWASELIGCKYDEGAKDITRVFFSTSAAPEDLLYLSPELFNPEMNRPMEVSITAAELPKMESTQTLTAPVRNAQDSTPNPAAYSYEGFPFSQIIDKYWELFNEGKTPTEGGRNSGTFELAKDLRCICDFSVDKLLKVIPVYDGIDINEWRQTITNANNEPRKGLTYRTRKVLESLKSEQRKDLPWGMNSATPPLLTTPLPAPLKKITATTPDFLKTTVSEASFAPLATHLHGVTFRQIDGTESEPALMQILIYRQSRGKGSIDRPIGCIVEDLLNQDHEARKREQEWKLNNPTGKKKKKRPDDIFIQVCQSDMTNAAFVQRLIDADRNGQRPIYTQMQELDEITALSVNGKCDVSRVIRKAFDRSEYGQERIGSDSVTGVAPLRWNFTAATTPIRAQQICTSWVGDGTLSRCNLLTIDPQEKPGQPKYKPITPAYKKSIAPYIQALNNAQGLVLCKKAEQLAERLRDELDDMSATTDSESLSIFASRAITIAYNKAMILYIMNGHKWSKDIENYVEWSLKRDLWVKQHHFGQKLEDDLEKENNMKAYHPKNILDALPNTFSLDQFKQARDQNGCKGNYKEHIKKLRQRHKIEYDDTSQVFIKIAS